MPTYGILGGNDYTNSLFFLPQKYQSQSNPENDRAQMRINFGGFVVRVRHHHQHIHGRNNSAQQQGEGQRACLYEAHIFADLPFLYQVFAFGQLLFPEQGCCQLLFGI